MLHSNFHIFLLTEKKVVFVSIKKPEEDPSLDKSYRPVSFFSVVCKLTEHISVTHFQNFLSDISDIPE